MITSEHDDIILCFLANSGLYSPALDLNDNYLIMHIDRSQDNSGTQIGTIGFDNNDIVITDAISNEMWEIVQRPVYISGLATTKFIIDIYDLDCINKIRFAFAKLIDAHKTLERPIELRDVDTSIDLLPTHKSIFRATLYR